MSGSEPVRSPRTAPVRNPPEPGIALAIGSAAARRAVGAPAARMSAAPCSVHFDAYLKCLDDFEVKLGDCYYYIERFNLCRERADASH